MMGTGEWSKFCATRNPRHGSHLGLASDAKFTIGFQFLLRALRVLRKSATQAAVVRGMNVADPIRRQIGAAVMKILLVVLLLIGASSQFACRPLAAGAAGAAVGVAVERHHQRNEQEEREREAQRLREEQQRNGR